MPASSEAPEGRRLALESGIGHEREFIRFWSLAERQRNRSSSSGRSSAAAPGPSSSVTNRSRPSMITTGSRESFARARSAAAAAASATASQVACSSQSAGVGASAPVVQRLHAGEPDRHVELAVAPGAAEAVGDQHGGSAVGPPAR